MDNTQAASSSSEPRKVTEESATPSFFQKFKFKEAIRKLGLCFSVSEKKISEPFICKICLEAILKREDAAELSCRHRFCRSCVTRHVEAKITENSFPVTCLDQDCDHDLTIDLKSIISNALNDRLVNIQFKSWVGVLPNMKHCLTPDCPGTFEVDDGVAVLDCPLCSKKYCLNCLRKAHEGLLCSEVVEKDREGEKVIAYLKEKECKLCPQCKFGVERSRGCNHMTCRCKFEFCYRCGQKWTPHHSCLDLDQAQEQNPRMELEEYLQLYRSPAPNDPPSDLRPPSNALNRDLEDRGEPGQPTVVIPHLADQIHEAPRQYAPHQEQKHNYRSQAQRLHDFIERRQKATQAQYVAEGN